MIHSQMVSYCMFRKRMFRLGGEGAWGDAYGVGYLRSMRVVCYSLRVSRKRNVVLLVKLKDAPVVVDGDRVWGMGYVTWNATVVSTCEEHRPGSFC